MQISQPYLICGVSSLATRLLSLSLSRSSSLLLSTRELVLRCCGIQWWLEHAYGDKKGRVVGGIKVKNVVDLKVSGLFFAIQKLKRKNRVSAEGFEPDAAASLVPASFSIPKEGKSSLSLKDSTLFGLSLSESFKADFSSSALRCKALLHAFVACNRKLIVDWVPAEDLEDETFKEDADAYNAAWSLLKGANGILVPGGFGDRGVQGKILAAKYARENSVPYLGICLGMQIALIEFSRSVLGLHDANSTEFEPETKNPCVIFMPEV